MSNAQPPAVLGSSLQPPPSFALPTSPVIAPGMSTAPFSNHVQRSHLLLSDTGSFYLPTPAAVDTHRPSPSTQDARSSRHLRLLTTSTQHRPPRSTTRTRYPHHLRLGNPHAKEAYRRKRFLVFAKLLLKCLQKQQETTRSPEDFTVYLEAKAVIADCTRQSRNRSSTPRRRLVDVLTHSLKPVVGTVQWNRAEACLDLYLQKRRRLREQQHQRDSLRVIQRYQQQSRQRVPDPLDVLSEIQKRRRI